MESALAAETRHPAPEPSLDNASTHGDMPLNGTARRRRAAAPRAAQLGSAAMARAAQRRTKRRGPFKIADTYLFAQIAAATLRSLVWFAGLLIIAGALTAVRRFANGELSPVGMAQVLIYQLPRVFVFTLPMSTLFGTVSTFADLSNRGEITALGAGGWSLTRLLRAPLTWGALLAIVAFGVQEGLVPNAETRKAEILKEQGIEMVAKAGPVSIRIPARGPLQSVVQAERFDPHGDVLIKPSIQFYERLRPTILVEARKGFWDQDTGQWKFKTGSITQFPQESARGEAFNVMKFDEIWRDDVPSPDKLSKSGKTLAEHLQNGDFEMVAIGDLHDWRTQLQQERRKTVSEFGATHDEMIRGATFGIHDKFATPLICLALILVGAPLGIRPQRASGGFSVGISLIVIMVYYVTWTWASQLGKVGKIPPLPAAYGPLVLTLIAGSFLVWKKSR